MKNIFITCLVAIASGVLSGGLTALYITHYRTGPLTTTKLSIVDESGALRAKIGVNGEREVALDLMSPDNARLLSIGIRKTLNFNGESAAGTDHSRSLWVPTFELDDVNGRASATFTTIADGNAILRFYAPKDQFRIGLGYIGDGSDYGDSQGAWGFRARRGFDETSIGILDFETKSGDRYLSPNVNKPFSAAVRAKPSR